MKIDMHIHSKYSPDARGSIRDIIKQAKKMGLDGIAITDHNEIKGANKAYELVKKTGFVVIRGIEISSTKGHILGIGVDKKIPRGLSPIETIEYIEEIGGVTICPHPYRFWSGLGEKLVRRNNFVGIETINNRSTKRGNNRAKKLAIELGLGEIGGSDCHSIETLGTAVTIFETGDSEDDIAQQIIKRKTMVEGTSRTTLHSIKYGYECISKWLSRGLKRI